MHLGNQTFSVDKIVPKPVHRVPSEDVIHQPVLLNESRHREGRKEREERKEDLRNTGNDEDGDLYDPLFPLLPHVVAPRWHRHWEGSFETWS